MTTATHPATRGLKGVVAAETALGGVRGDEGFYHYRQYAAPELAEKRTFEAVWCLFVDGALPGASGAAAFRDEVAPMRHLPAEVVGALPAIATSSTDPSAALRTAVSHLSAVLDLRPSLDASAEELRTDALRIGAAVPTLVAGLHRLRTGGRPVPARDDLGFAANYLHMISGSEPDPAHARALEQYLILAIDHGLNASTFTARVVASTGADLGAAVVAALGALSGPLHGGAPSRALDTVEAIGDPVNAEAWVRRALERGERIMGFGHPVYRAADPRSTMLRAIAQRLGGDLVDRATVIERAVERTLTELKPDRPLRTNVEYYAAVVMELCGVPRELFTSTFAASRTVGWCAHALEQARKGRIIRPNSVYTGPPPPQPVPDAA
ncbi:MAG TPA: citrate synthase [Nitriliruptorales bacterium]